MDEEVALKEEASVVYARELEWVWKRTGVVV